VQISGADRGAPAQPQDFPAAWRGEGGQRVHCHTIVETKIMSTARGAVPVEVPA
jgi:hypothetical protein